VSEATSHTVHLHHGRTIVPEERQIGSAGDHRAQENAGAELGRLPATGRRQVTHLLPSRNASKTTENLASFSDTAAILEGFNYSREERENNHYESNSGGVIYGQRG